MRSVPTAPAAREEAANDFDAGRGGRFGGRQPPAVRFARANPRSSRMPAARVGVVQRVAI